MSAALGAWGVGEQFADVPLLTSELVTNAVRHVGGDVEMSIELDELDRVRLEVTDYSENAPVMRDLDGARYGGWGLHIVEQLATTWGLEPRAGGKTVWCEVAKPRP